MSRFTKLLIWIGAALVGGAFISFLFLTKTPSTAKALSIGYFYTAAILVVFKLVHRLVASKLSVFSPAPQIILRSLLYAIALSFGYLAGFVFQTVLLMPIETVQDVIVTNAWKGFVYLVSSPFGGNTSVGIVSPEWRTISLTFFALIFLISLVSIVGSVVEIRWQENKQKQAIERAELNALRLENERHVLEVDNRRKTQELEEARDLQLSMRPKVIPKIPNLEIAVHMQTATEVGGDYYDFKQGDDNTLTIAIGDATGHGARAGIMVAAAKSLFSVLGGAENSLSILDKINETIIGMNLGIYMALTLVKISGDKVVIAAAGMPPAMVFRKKSSRVEEIVVKGMPLGAHSGFAYTEKETTLKPGDTLLLMSDGFPELFNENNELLDSDRVKSLFLEGVDRSPDRLIAHLLNAGEEWRKSRPQEDDMTFVVVRMKERSDDRRI